MATLPVGPSEVLDVKLLANEELAEGAFTRLWAQMEDRLVRVATRVGLAREDAEDAVQTLAANLWERRRSLAELTVGAFWAFSVKSVKNLAIDRIRRQTKIRMVSLEEDRDIPVEDLAYVDAVVEFAMAKGAIYSAANRLWLGERPDTATSVLAVQLCISEGLRPEEASLIAGISSDEVSRLLKCPVIARYAAYSALMWESEALVGYILDPEKPPSDKDIEAMLRRLQHGEAVSIGQWTSFEIAVLILHIRYGMNEKEIERLLCEKMADVDVETVRRAGISRYPFPSIAMTASRVLIDCVEEGLRSHRLWQRLVFEYHLRFQLPHSQILDRVAPASECVGFDLKPTTLNSWLGNGRLWSQLATFLDMERNQCR